MDDDVMVFYILDVVDVDSNISFFVNVDFIIEDDDDSEQPGCNIEDYSTLHSESIECCICFNMKDTHMRINKCNHLFCTECCTEWFKRSIQCPLCKRDVIY